MEWKIRENPYSAASPPPENLRHPLFRRFLPTENHPHTPLITNLHTSDQAAIESAFSRLTLSPDFRFHAQTPSFIGLPATLDPLPPPDSAPSLMTAFAEKQQALYWAQVQTNNGGVSVSGGPHGFSAAHHKINVGPESMGFLGRRSPYLHHAGDHNLMKFHQRQDFFVDAAYCDNYDQCNSLHGKEPFLRKPNFCSSMSSLYSNQQQLYCNLQQQLSTIENMRGKIVSLAKDQVLCGILDMKLDQGLSEEQIEMVLPEVMECLVDLMRNQFGSHFVQKLFAACNEDQRTRIIVALTRFPFKLISVCINCYGARGMQKLMEKLITPEQISFVVSALSPGVISLATDANGQHVVQYCVKNFPGEYNKHLFNEIANNCFKIATNKSGCCLLQSCVEHSHGEARKRLISEIIANGVHLAEDPYGNYVVQHLIGMKMQQVTEDLLRRFQRCFVSLSCNKYASNVVEKFLTESEENHSATVIMELLTSPNASILLLDPFGNFVIQSALSVSRGQVHNALLKLIKVNEPSMQSNLYGKKILAWLEKRKPQNA